MPQSFEKRLNRTSIDERSSDISLVLEESETADVRASAPGRVEFIGNHTDYNGGWVLGATIDRRVEGPCGVARTAGSGWRAKPRCRPWTLI